MDENNAYILNGWTGAQVILALQKALAGGIPDGSITSVKLDDGCVTLTKLGNDLVVKKQSINLLNPENINNNPDAMYGYFFVQGLTPNSYYSVKIDPEYVYDVATIGDESVTLDYSTSNSGIIVKLPDGYNSFSIAFENPMDISNLMVVEGTIVPDTYEPYDTEEYIVNESLIKYYFDKFYDDITKVTENLFNPDDIILPSSTSTADSTITISGLKIGLPYSFNFKPSGVEEPVSGSSLGYIETSAGVYTITYAPESVKFYIDRKIDCSGFMLVEGTEIPQLYIPYGKCRYINDELLKPVAAELSNLNSKRETIVTERLSKFHLIKNYIYTLTASYDIRFILPDTAENGDQILVQADIQKDDAIVEWGTTYYFNNVVPDIDVGRYNFIFEYDDGVWYAGAIPKGQVVE